MKHSTLKNIVLPGIFCAACLGASVWYSVVFNHSRLIAPTDFSTYVFRVQDLPLMLACILCAAYLIWLFVRGFQHAQQQKSSATTRTIDPRFGFLGLLGFLGVLGFWVYPQTGEVFPFAFFLFFGFFGFFFEGKMSHTLMDERYTENRAKAQLTAAKTALSIIFVAVILLAQGRGGDAVLIALLIVLSLTLALYLFLSEYLLYRYDHDDLPAEDFDESED